MSTTSRLPVTLLTGFLGSGKTTLFARLLKTPGIGRIAAIVNEFGDIDLDYDLLEASSEDIVVLGNGCLCCALRGSLADTLRNLVAQRQNDPRFAFDRVIVETSGLADPVPVLRLLLGDPWIADRFGVAGVVTLVDAVNGERTLAEHPEAVSQATVADLLLITKTDLAPPPAVAALDRRLASLNPTARRLPAVRGEIEAALILDPQMAPSATPALAAVPSSSTARELAPGWEDAAGSNDDAHRHGDGYHGHGDGGHGRDDDADLHGDHRVQHDPEIRSVSFTFARPLAAQELERLLTVLRALSGPGLLRAKGIIAVAGQATPLAVHAVQDVVHPPEPLPAVRATASSRLVVIGRRLDPAGLDALAALAAG